MKFTITQKELAILQEKSKLFSYLSSTMTKTYFGVGDGKFVVFFRGVKGAAKLVLSAPEASEPVRVFQIDYAKWLNAIAKQSFADEITIALTEKYLKVSIDGSSDMISLGITPYEESSSEAEVLQTFIESNKLEGNELVLTEELADTISVATSMLSAAAHNNAIALNADSVMYADRSIVFQAKLQESIATLAGRGSVDLHKYTVGFLVWAMKFNNVFHFSDDFQQVYWVSDSGDSCMTVLLTSEPCEIAIPTPEELQAIQPAGETGSMVIDHRELAYALEFFNGFYEASVWKPITFTLSASGASKLYYKHPTTEISKELDAKVTLDCDFALSSENMSKILNRSIALTENKPLDVQFTYDEDAAGVRCVIGDYFDVVFAKLIS